ncbi:MAG: hypothetical protein V4480_04395 [Patescibacteria group bacterium]
MFLSALTFRSNIFKETSMLFSVTVIGGLLPLIIGLAISLILSQWHGWTVFWSHGEFYLYAAAFYINSAYLLYATKKKNFDFSSVLFWLCICFLILSSVLYAILATTLSIPIDGLINPDKAVIFYSSLVFLLIALFAHYFSNYIDRLSKGIDVAEEERRSIDGIKKSLR